MRIINQSTLAKQTSNQISVSSHDDAQWQKFLLFLKEKQSIFSDVSSLNNIERVQEVASKFQTKKKLVHIGIGGSCLGTKAIFESLTSKCNILFIENIERDLASLLANENHQELVFHIVSKSGNTVEVIFQLKQILEYLKTNGIQDHQYKDYFVLTSSQHDSALYNFACQYGLEQLLIPLELGGRFSVLSSVSLFPCAFYDIDIEALLKGASGATSFLNTRSQELKNFADTIFKLYKQGIDQNVLMPYDSRLTGFTQWFSQLWAESLGKQTSENQFVGITPISSLGSRDQHSLLQLYLHGPLNKLIIFIVTKDNKGKEDYAKINNALQSGCELALKEVNRPYSKISLDKLDEESMGELFQFFHYACVYLAAQLGINPYDQPAVELAKRHTKSLLDLDLTLD